MSTYYNSSSPDAFNISSLPAPFYLKNFLQHEVNKKGLSHHSANNYYVSIQLFMKWLLTRDQNGRDMDETDISGCPMDVIRKVAPKDINAFLSYCKNVRGNSPASCASKLSALKSFFNYLADTVFYIPDDPAAGITAPRPAAKSPKILSVGEAQAVLSASRTGKTPERDHCIVCLMLYCGLSLAEIVRINVVDVLANSIDLTGPRARTIYLNEECQKSVESYLKERLTYKNMDKNALFISWRFGARLTARAVEQTIEKIYARAGLEGKGYSAISLRHTAAALLCRTGNASKTELQEILGHSTPQSAAKYVKAESTRVMRLMLDVKLPSD